MFTTTSNDRLVVSARTGRAVRLRAGDRVRITDLYGGQVGDVFAFAGDEYDSAEHTRAHTDRVFPAVGDELVTNRRRPILTLVADDSPGRHDMLIAACDPERYAALGAPGHASCAQNLHDALAALGFATRHVPQPVNVFMDVPIGPGGGLSMLPATTSAGDSITFAALLDCVFVLSACPQDLTAINGGVPTDLAIDISNDIDIEERP